MMCATRVAQYYRQRLGDVSYLLEETHRSLSLSLLALALPELSRRDSESPTRTMLTYHADVPCWRARARCLMAHTDIKGCGV